MLMLVSFRASICVTVALLRIAGNGARANILAQLPQSRLLLAPTDLRLVLAQPMHRR